jgi:hypothetical protein
VIKNLLEYGRFRPPSRVWRDVTLLALAAAGGWGGLAMMRMELDYRQLHRAARAGEVTWLGSTGSPIELKRWKTLRPLLLNPLRDDHVLHLEHGYAGNSSGGWVIKHF